VQNGKVATITINRPQARNAFDDILVHELTAAFTAINTGNSENDPRVVVLTGAGTAFCAGADIGWMRRSQSYTKDENIRDTQAMAALFETIDGCPLPVIARVNGAAIGGGAGLVACADIAIATSSAKFGFTEVRLGIIPAVISDFVLGKISLTAARRLFLTGEVFDAEHARTIGLCSEVVDAEVLDDHVAALAAAIVDNGPVAIQRAKAWLRELATRKLSRSEVLARAATDIAELRASSEGQEGLRAFLEKRPPSWQE